MTRSLKSIGSANDFTIEENEGKANYYIEEELWNEENPLEKVGELLPVVDLNISISDINFGDNVELLLGQVDERIMGAFLTENLLDNCVLLEQNKTAEEHVEEGKQNCMTGKHFKEKYTNTLKEDSSNKECKGGTNERSESFMTQAMVMEEFHLQCNDEKNDGNDNVEPHNINHRVEEDIHKCPYCKFQTLDGKALLDHLDSHPDELAEIDEEQISNVEEIVTKSLSAPQVEESLKVKFSRKSVQCQDCGEKFYEHFIAIHMETHKLEKRRNEMVSSSATSKEIIHKEIARKRNCPYKLRKKKSSNSTLETEEAVKASVEEVAKTVEVARTVDESHYKEAVKVQKTSRRKSKRGKIRTKKVVVQPVTRSDKNGGTQEQNETFKEQSNVGTSLSSPVTIPTSSIPNSLSALNDNDLDDTPGKLQSEEENNEQTKQEITAVENGEENGTLDKEGIDIAQSQINQLHEMLLEIIPDVCEVEEMGTHMSHRISLAEENKRHDEDIHKEVDKTFTDGTTASLLQIKKSVYCPDCQEKFYEYYFPTHMKSHSRDNNTLDRLSLRLNKPNKNVHKSETEVSTSEKASEGVTEESINSEDAVRKSEPVGVSVRQRIRNKCPSRNRRKGAVKKLKSSSSLTGESNKENSKDVITNSNKGTKTPCPKQRNKRKGLIGFQHDSVKRSKISETIKASSSDMLPCFIMLTRCDDILEPRQLKSANKIVQSQLFKCKQCPKEFTKVSELNNHSSCHSSVATKKSYKCPYCEKMEQSRWSLHSHVNSSHRSLLM